LVLIADFLEGTSAIYYKQIFIRVALQNSKV